MTQFDALRYTDCATVAILKHMDNLCWSLPKQTKLNLKKKKTNQNFTHKCSLFPSFFSLSSFLLFVQISDLLTVHMWIDPDSEIIQHTDTGQQHKIHSLRFGSNKKIILHKIEFSSFCCCCCCWRLCSTIAHDRSVAEQAKNKKSQLLN